MKSKIIARIRDNIPGQCTKEQAEIYLKAVTEAVTHVATSDGRATIPGFGTFRQRYREGREVRNPRTHEMTRTAAKTVITFRQAKGK